MDDAIARSWRAPRLRRCRDLTIEHSPLPNRSVRQLLRNMVVGYASYVFAAVASLVLTPVLVRFLGAADYGALNLFSTVGTYLGLVEVGVATTMVQRVAAYLAVGRVKELGRLLSAGRSIYLAGSVLIATVWALVVVFLPSIFDVRGIPIDDARLAAALLGLSSVATYLATPSGAILFGGGRSDTAGLIGIAGASVLNGSQIAAAALAGGMVAVAGAICGSAVFAAALSLIFARRTFPYLFGPSDGDKWDTTKDLLRSGSRNALLATAGSFSYGLDTIFIGLLLPVARVTPYVIAVGATGVVTSLATIGTGRLMPVISHAASVGDSRTVERLFSGSIVASLTIAIPLEAVLIACGRPLLRIWLHNVPPDTYSVMIVLAVVAIFVLPGTQVFQLLSAMEKNGQLARFAIPATLSNIAITLVTTPILGPIGPAIASLPQAILYESGVSPRCACRVLGLSGRRLLLQIGALVAPLIILSASLSLVEYSLVHGSDPLVVLPTASLIPILTWAAMTPLVVRRYPDVVASVMRRSAVTT